MLNCEIYSIKSYNGIFQHIVCFYVIVQEEFSVFMYCQKKWPESQEAMVNEVLALQVANRKKPFLMAC